MFMFYLCTSHMVDCISSSSPLLIPVHSFFIVNNFLSRLQNAAATAAEIVKVIQKTEAEFQSSLESSYNQMR